MNRRVILFPSEIASDTIEAGIRKGNYPLYKLIPLGMLAGIFISIGALASSVLKVSFPSSEAHMATLYGALSFTIGIVLVVVAGGELFTGNMLMFLAVLDKKLSVKRLLRNWGLIYLLNFVGVFIVVLITYYSGSFSDNLVSAIVKVSVAKSGLSFSSALFKGIGCNILVCLSVWICTSAKDTTGKVVASSFPVIVFILLGFEHCIANMFYFSTALFNIPGSIPLSDIFLNNLIPVTIGNIIGGVSVALLYFFSFVFRERKAE